VLATITVNMSVFTGLGGGALEALLADNVPAGPFEMPVLLAQGTTDTIIDPAAQAEFAARLCADGAPLDYRTYDGLGHVALVDTDSPYLDDLMAWTTARLSGLIPHVPGSSAD